MTMPLRSGLRALAGLVLATLAACSRGDTPPPYAPGLGIRKNEFFICNFFINSILCFRIKFFFVFDFRFYVNL